MAGWFHRQVFSIQAWGLIPGRIRGNILRRIGISLDRTAYVTERVQFGGTSVVIGDHSFINVDCYIEGVADTVLGSYVFVGPNCRLLNSTHRIGGRSKRAGEDLHLAIKLCDGAWLGAGVIILPGVTVGAGCVIAAGAVVVKDTVKNALYAGIPARLVKHLPVD